ncbi:MAG: hypothetical protein R3358_02340 [Woeseiaceae bacterium]|nr:hypothetical protein [Woeseiaceae bacterium]
MNDPIRIQARSVGRVEIDPDSHQVIDGERIANRSFDGVELEKFTAINSRFTNCTFVDARIRDACWGGGRKRTDYVECSFDGAQFGSISPGNARFVDCSFDNVRISEFFARDIELIDCKFSGLLEKGFLNGRRDATKFRFFERRRNKIEGNDFSECELRDFSFRTGIRLERGKLPSGPNYVFIDDLRSALEGARAHVAGWDSANDRRLGDAIIQSMEIDLKGGQRQQLYVVHDTGQFATVSKCLASFFASG